MATQQVQQGWSQMTAAAQQIIRSGIGSIGRGTTSRRRKRASSTPRAKKSSTRSTSSKPRKASSAKRHSKSTSGRLKKGSLAAKRHMAKLRAMRK